MLWKRGIERGRRENELEKTMAETGRDVLEKGLEREKEIQVRLIIPALWW